MTCGYFPEEIFTLLIGLRLGDVSFLAVVLDEMSFKFFLLVICFTGGIVLQSPGFMWSSSIKLLILAKFRNFFPI